MPRVADIDGWRGRVVLYVVIVAIRTYKHEKNKKEEERWSYNEGETENKGPVVIQARVVGDKFI